jgi:hypothetical protein
MALASGIAAAEAILSGMGAPAFHAAWRRRSAPAMRWAGIGAWLLRRAPAAFAAAVPVLGRTIAERTRVSGRGGTFGAARRIPEPSSHPLRTWPRAGGRPGAQGT